MPANLEKVGVVAIGRNEGDRLRKCLESLAPLNLPVVYVDSASSDGSVALARSMKASVVELDMSIPFTAARARNAGYQRLKEVVPDLQYVQFVDGDCRVDGDWISTATDFLNGHADAAVVCGRRRETHPEASIYNRLCDIEWNTPVGEARSFGGDCLIRVTAFEAAEGYRDDVIAGEEPELAVRMRKADWRIWRVDADMTFHDANILRFSQWWRRTLRGGYAYALGTYLHGRPPIRHWRTETISITFWGIVLPAAIIAAGAVYPPLFAGFLIYPAQVVRISLRTRSWGYGFFTVLGKFPQAQGAAGFWLDLLQGKRRGIIEY